MPRCSPALTAGYLGSGPLPPAAPCCCCRGWSSASWWGGTARGTAPPPSRSSGPRYLQGKGGSLGTSLRSRELPRTRADTSSRSLPGPTPAKIKAPPDHRGSPRMARGSARSLTSRSNGSEGVLLCLFAVLLGGTPVRSEEPQGHLRTGPARLRQRASSLGQGWPQLLGTSGRCPRQPHIQLLPPPHPRLWVVSGP